MVTLNNNSSDVEHKCNKDEPNWLAVAEKQARDMGALNSCFVGHQEELAVFSKHELQILVAKWYNSPVVDD